MKKATVKRPLKKPTLGKFNAADLIEAVTSFADQLARSDLGTLRTTTITLPGPLPGRSAAQIRAVRKKLGASQAVFATLLNVPLRTVSSWENNQRKPSGAALKLLDIAERHPEVLTNS